MNDSVRRRLLVRGTVQGVGFRPFVFREATALGLAGYVYNNSAGVTVEVEGDLLSVGRLIDRIRTDPPGLAVVDGLDVVDVAVTGEPGFAIRPSPVGGDPHVPVSIDAASCDECLAEVDDPGDRRYRYPFTNCTNCGPRYTIVRSVPYDRPATTMADFTMCSRCQAEYDDPGDRRFHAQPNACPDCGPRLTWTAEAESSESHGDDALAAAIAALDQGLVVAVKGVGGYHLAVDATNESAVNTLRRRKSRDDKPFAVMVTDAAAAEDLVELTDEALVLLVSTGRPIVIGPARPSAGLAPGVAPDTDDVGVLLPYSPLHHLLLAGVGRPLVMTSGNLSDEPIAHEDLDAQDRLAGLADGFLVHDRPIHIRCDDSVVRDRPGRGPQMLRRSRGFAPQPRPLPLAARLPILAVGAELKSTVAVTTGEQVVASHHIGDLEQLATYRSFLQAVDHMCGLFGVAPEVVAHDLHPEYLSTKFATELSLDACPVQHHHAHIASCLVDNLHRDPVVGLAFDGLGFGADGTLWGGEVLIADLRGFERVGHLHPVVMPGGGAAIREPWRMGLAWASEAGVEATFDDDRSAGVRAVIDAKVGPVTSSVGRLLDAVSALIGLVHRVTFEAQAAIALEVAARRVPRSEADPYPCARRLDEGAHILDPRPMLAAVAADLRRGLGVEVIAANVHEGLGRAAAELAADIAQDRGIDTVALSGGVFQNVRLSEIVEQALTGRGLRVLQHHSIPANDGGISTGQAAIAAALHS